MIIFFIYTHDLLQKAVKLETSLLALDKNSGSSEDMMLKLVMDESPAHEIMLKRLMNDAHAQIILNISSNYFIDTPTDLEQVFTEFPDFRQDRDFNLFLNMHSDWPLNYKKSVDIKIQQYLVDYICYRWLETKAPNEAMTYKSRLAGTLDDMKRLLIRKTNPIKRQPSFP